MIFPRFFCTGISARHPRLRLIGRVVGGRPSGSSCWPNLAARKAAPRAAKGCCARCSPDQNAVRGRRAPVRLPDDPSTRPTCREAATSVPIDGAGLVADLRGSLCEFFVHSAAGAAVPRCHGGFVQGQPFDRGPTRRGGGRRRFRVSRGNPTAKLRARTPTRAGALIDRPVGGGRRSKTRQFANGRPTEI